MNRFKIIYIIFEIRFKIIILYCSDCFCYLIGIMVENGVFCFLGCILEFIFMIFFKFVLFKFYSFLLFFSRVKYF